MTASSTLGKWQLIVSCWTGESWRTYTQRRGLPSREVAELLGREEMARAVWRSNFRPIRVVVLEDQCAIE